MLGRSGLQRAQLNDGSSRVSQRGQTAWSKMLLPRCRITGASRYAYSSQRAGTPRKDTDWPTRNPCCEQSPARISNTYFEATAIGRSALLRGSAFSTIPTIRRSAPMKTMSIGVGVLQGNRVQPWLIEDEKQAGVHGQGWTADEPIGALLG